MSNPRDRPACSDHPGQLAHRADTHVGARIRTRRITLGLSQQQLSESIGISYQQAHKYERAYNRISIGRLYDLAQVLRVPVSWFFEGLADRRAAEKTTRRERMLLELIRNFEMISNQAHQQAVLQLARAFADGPATPDEPPLSEAPQHRRNPALERSRTRRKIRAE